MATTPISPIPAPVPAQHHFNWLSFLIISGAIAADSVGTAEIAQPGSNPFVSPVFDVALFKNILLAVKASQQ